MLNSDLPKPFRERFQQGSRMHHVSTHTGSLAYAPPLWRAHWKRLQKLPQIPVYGKGRWMDNVFIERLWRSVKYEDIYLREYTGGHKLHAGLIRHFRFYNNERPTARSTTRPQRAATPGAECPSKTEDSFIAFMPIRCMEERPPENPRRPHRLGPWDGAQFAFQRCPILRPGQHKNTRKHQNDGKLPPTQEIPPMRTHGARAPATNPLPIGEGRGRIGGRMKHTDNHTTS